MVPLHVQHQVKSKYELDKNTIILIESRPKWDDGSVWIDMDRYTHSKDKIRNKEHDLETLLCTRQWQVDRL